MRTGLGVQWKLWDLRGGGCAIGAGGVAPRLFQMVEESEHRLGAKAAQCQLVDPDAVVSGQERQQKSEGVPIGRDGVLTQATLDLEVVGEETLDQGNKRIAVHGRDLLGDIWNRRNRLPAHRSERGSAETYHQVEVNPR